MTKPNLFRDGWIHVKEYAPAVMAAALMFGGVHQILGAVRYFVAGVILKGIDAVILQGFRDRLPLPNDYIGIPWQFQTKIVAEGVIVLVLGMFIGLWVNARSQRQPAS